MKVMTILGTRPEAIKLAPIIHRLQQESANYDLEPILCVTGQHREMLDQVLSLFNIVPDYDLNVMAHKQTPTQVAAMILAQLEPILKETQPDWILVQGDTTTVMAAALAAFYARIKVGHVEAGLRTWDKWQPFPEEVNRKVAGVVADLHFAPTEQSYQNLRQENIPSEQIVVTGNPVIDALYWVIDQPLTPEVTSFLAECGWNDATKAASSSLKTIMVTAHRRENFGAPLAEVCSAIKEISEFYGDQVSIIYPVHMNPNVWEPVHKALGNLSNVKLIPPLDYQNLVHLMKQADIVLTDSGGIQEEAPGLGKPVLVLREVTERPEAVISGTVKLVGTDRALIVSEVKRLLGDADAYAQMSQAVNPYGDGRAAERIVNAILGKPVSQFKPKSKISQAS